MGKFGFEMVNFKSKCPEIGSGIGQDGFWNVDLMGTEGPPTVKQAKEMLSHDLETAKKIGGEISEYENVSL